MAFEGILIGTGILWALKLIGVFPLTQYFTKRQLEQEEIRITNLNGGELSAETKARIEAVSNKCYILADVIVLGIAGFLIGTALGSPFIGISFEARGWPGMIAFIVSSGIGAAMRA